MGVDNFRSASIHLRLRRRFLKTGRGLPVPLNVGRRRREGTFLRPEGFERMAGEDLLRRSDHARKLTRACSSHRRRSRHPSRASSRLTESSKGGSLYKNDLQTVE